MPKLIGVIDDSGTVRDIIGAQLCDLGYGPVLTDSIEQALDNSEKIDFRAFLVDLILPGLSGVEGIPMIKAKWPDAGIVAISAGGDEALVSARRAGAHRVLRKPFVKDTLSETLDGLLASLDDKETILVVEDSRTVRRFVCMVLRKAGYHVLEAGSMEDALASPHILSVDLVLTDIFMPGLGGIAGIQRIRSNWPHVPIIAMSGDFGDDAQKDNALAAARKIGANAALRKPFGIDHLLTVVARVLGE